MLLHEKHRPRDWDSVVGQPRAVKLLRGRQHGGCAYWLTGKSGTGKTSIARLIAADHADDFCVDEYDAGEMTPARIREIERAMSIRGMGSKSGRVCILNEAHGLKGEALRVLLSVTEPIQSHACWIFTTTFLGEKALFDKIDGSPLIGRCVPVPLEQRSIAEPFAQRALDIARAEGLDGRPLKDYVRLINDCRGSLRMALSKIEAGEMLP